MGVKNNRHVAVLRFSALGDVAIASPLVKAYAQANPGVVFTVVSRPMLEPLFEGVPNLRFYPIMPQSKHKGIKGLYALYRELLSLGVTDVADIHSVLRTHILRFFFAFSRVSFRSMDKGRSEKARLTAKENKILEKLTSSMGRYEKVLCGLGFDFLDFADKPLDINAGVKDRDYSARGSRRVGIAPFAKHKGKEWPVAYMERVVAALSQDDRYSVTLFGGGARESALLKGWEQKYSGVRSVAGELGFKEELELMAGLDLMVCMDSANMHFASAMGVPVLSVWGATHPWLGFYGWGQDPSMAVMAPAECRPCSVFGNKECYRGDYICLEGLQPEELTSKIVNFFDSRL